MTHPQPIPQPFEAPQSGLNPILKTILWLIGILGGIIIMGLLL